MNRSASVSRFSLSRFKLVLKRYMVLNQRTWIIGFLSVGGFLLLISILPYISDMINLTGGGFSSIRDTAIFFYVLGGLLLTSMIFNEIHTPNSAFQFLTLPATTFEKLASVWFATTIVYTLAAISGIFVLSVIYETVEGINLGIWSRFSLFNPFQPQILSTILSYLFYQSIFLLGAVYFRKNNFLKTFLVIITFFLGLFFFVNIIVLIIGLSQFEGFSFGISLGPNAPTWLTILEYLVGFILTLMFLLFSYLQLKNKQVV